jgi:glycerate 2-kinase
MSEALRATARALFKTTLAAVDVRSAVDERIAIREGMLHLGEQSAGLAGIDRLLIVSMGKAAVPMYEAAAAKLDSLRVEAVVVAPRETVPAAAPEFFLAGDHPTPGEGARDAASLALAVSGSATGRDAVLFLISGGASAMVEQPLDASISVEDMATFHRALVGSGMVITEMNALRKHLSRVKGGRLAQAAAGARVQCTLLISDVPAASPDAIASGPSLPDSTTVADCRRLFARLQQSAFLPESIVKFFGGPRLPETPKAGDPVFAQAAWEVVLSGEHLANAAAKAAQAAGFHTVIDNTCDDWEYRDAARYLLDRSAALAAEHGRTCLISVGEVGVSIGSEYGEGGRNGQFALWCALELATRGVSATMLSAGSDGIDGHSDAAGAVCDETSAARAAGLDLSVAKALSQFDSAPLLRSLGDAIVTGPTGNNLRDLRLILTE